MKNPSEIYGRTKSTLQFVMEEEKEKANRVNIRLLFAIITIAVGSGFQYGYNIGVVNAPQIIMEAYIKETDGNRTNSANLTDSEVRVLWSVAVAISPVGGMFGGLAASVLAEKLGRKRGLIITNVILIVGGFIIAGAKLLASFEAIILGRFVIGFSSGLHVTLGPMLLVEIAPTEWRGAIGTTFQLVVTICILLSQILGQPFVFGTANLWPILFGIIIVPAVFQCFFLLFCPESPRYIMWKYQNTEKTQKVLVWLRNKDDVRDELKLIREETAAALMKEKASPVLLAKDPVYRTLFYISIIIMMSQQFSGINAIIYYSTQIFIDGGLATKDALYATIVLGVTNVLVTIWSLWLVERFGRRNLYLSNLFMLIIICTLITILLETQQMSGYVTEFAIALVVLIALYIIVFASGLGPIPLFIVHELFDQNTRSLASSLAIFVNLLCTVIVGLLFPVFTDLIEGYVFLIFAGFLLISLIYTTYKMPETKNQNPEDIREAIIHGINMRTGFIRADANVLPVPATSASKSASKSPSAGTNK